MDFLGIGRGRFSSFGSQLITADNDFTLLTQAEFINALSSTNGLLTALLIIIAGGLKPKRG